MSKGKNIGKLKNIVVETGTALRGMKQYLPVFAGSLVFSAVIYHLLMSHQLVNSNDGIWEYSYYKAGKWSLSLGRWFWLYLDRLRFGISTDPLTSMITLSLYSAGLMFVLDIFEMGKRKTGYLAAMLFLASVAVSSSLTYRFMSPTFGLAFLLSVLAAWGLVRLKNDVLAVFCGGILIALSMGLYQAYLGCTCIVLLGYFIVSLCFKNVDLKNILASMAKAAGAGALGGVLYVAVLKAHLAFFHMQMSDYNGGNLYSLSNTIRNLPYSIVRAYREFFRYFGGESYILSAFREIPLLLIFLALSVVFLINGLIRLFRTDKIKMVLYLILVMMIPLACNIVLLIATVAEVSVLMTPALVLCISVLLCVIVKAEASGVFFQWIRRLLLLLLAVTLYGSVYQVQIDQHALLEGQRAASTMAGEILHCMEEEGYLDPELAYCVVGVAGYNDLYAVSRVYERSNMYAHFGSWYKDPSCTRRSWQGIFSYLCGVNLTMCSSGDYSRLYEEEDVRNMPVYPEEGFIARIGDIVVVKVSDY